MREVVSIVLGGVEHQLRPTWEAYGEIEARCGPLFQLWQKVGLGGATLQEMAVIVAAGMRAAGSVDGRKIDETSVGRRIYEVGAFSDDVKLPILQFIEALGWTPEQRKKLEAEIFRSLGETSATSDGSSPS